MAQRFDAHEIKRLVDWYRDNDREVKQITLTAKQWQYFWYTRPTWRDGKKLWYGEIELIKGRQA